MKTALVLAPHYDRALTWATTNNLTKAQWRYVYDESAMRGYDAKNLAIVLLENWHVLHRSLDPLKDIIYMYKTKGAKVINCVSTEKQPELELWMKTTATMLT